MHPAKQTGGCVGGGAAADVAALEAEERREFASAYPEGGARVGRIGESVTGVIV